MKWGIWLKGDARVRHLPLLKDTEGEYWLGGNRNNEIVAHSTKKAALLELSNIKEKQYQWLKGETLFVARIGFYADI